MRYREDRRVKYTKALLKEALILLMKRTHISRISVTNLCEAADVNRSTFYAHYKDQYDLLRQLEEEVMSSIREYIEEREFDQATPISEQKLVRILEYGKRNAELILALLSENGGSHFQNDIMSFVSQMALIKNKQGDRTREYVSLFGVSGCVSVLKRWLELGTEESVDTMASLIWRLTQEGNMA